MDNPSNLITSYFSKIDNYVNNEEYQKARACLNKILKKDPGNLQALIKLSEVFLKLNLVSESKMVLKKVLQIDAQSADAIELSAICNVLEKDYKQAEALFRALLETNKLQGYFGLASLYASKGDLVSANAFSREAIKFLPFNVPQDNGKPIVLVIQSLGHNSFELNNASYELDVASNNMFSYVIGLVTVVRLFAEQYENEPEVLDKLPHIDLIYNGVADYDDSGHVLATLNRIIESVNRPVINPPLDSDLTSRDNNYRRLHDIKGIVFPVTLKLSPGETDEEAIQTLMTNNKLVFPILIRRAGTHVGKTFEKINSVDEYIKYNQNNKNSEVYLSQYYELDRDGIYRRFRIYCINQKICPSAVYYGKSWNVHRKSNVKITDPGYINDQKEFYENFDQFITPYLPAIKEIISRTPLEYFGIDFDILNSGNIIVFEVNAAMNVNHGNKIFEQWIESAIIGLFESKLNQKLAR